ncbi:hypothetical protein SAMN02910456_02141 [Ruminococcaceae bacterium YRB3002]|nr:hypothetical protein SAMN02910456_02141 [Ruminococcaceae bacterium YRB3002]
MLVKIPICIKRNLLLYHERPVSTVTKHTKTYGFRSFSYVFVDHFRGARKYNFCMYDYRQLELRMSFIRERLTKIPHGNLGTYRGRQVVSITYDPFDSTITYKNRKRYYVDSPQGKKYAPKIKEYIELSGELATLEEQWNLMYRMAPRSVPYPLTKTRVSLFDSRFYERAVPNSNDRPIKNPIKHKDMILRSKNELAGCLILDSKGIDYKVEVKVAADDDDEYSALYPDILFHLPEQDKCVGIEIDGAIDREPYSNKTFWRRRNYIRHDLQVGKDIIFYELDNPYAFDDKHLEALIDSAITANLGDIVFPDSLV